MHIAIITRSLPPEHGGIVDHTMLLGQSLRNFGHRVTFIAGRGNATDNNLIIEDSWCKKGLEDLLKRLDELAIDHLILQYIPLGFLPNKYSAFSCIKHQLDLKNFWQACSKKWHTSIIVHDIYYRVWSYPPSWIKGSLQKYLMQSMVRISRNAFSSSELLVQEMKNWDNPKKITWLPPSSNLPFSPIDKEKTRSEHKISNDVLILTLFSGGNALHSNAFYVNKIDRYFYKNNIPILWLLLGGISRDWFNLSSPVIFHNHLPVRILSAWLQLTDIFLAPHSCGLAARRTTFLAALQHGLPVVGTKGYITDPLMSQIQGLVLTSGAKKFLEEVINLSTAPALRRFLGDKNKLYYNENLGWGKLSNTLIKAIA